MSRFFTHIQIAKNIIESYEGTVPFAIHLKAAFGMRTNMGSKDRKAVTRLCYSFYRVGKNFNELPFEQKLAWSLYLTLTDLTDPYLLAAGVHEEMRDTTDLQQRLAIGEIAGFRFSKQFPLSKEVSPLIDPKLLSLNLLLQPDLFVRMRPGKSEKVIAKFSEAGLKFQVEENCIRLPNATRLPAWPDWEKDFVIQDKSSQQCGEVLSVTMQQQIQPVQTAWDACAASGGKTILLHDVSPTLKITVSDIRESILHNLHARLQAADVPYEEAFVANLSKDYFTGKQFDLVLADVPCSGSGTWGRTPEHLARFSARQLTSYTEKQKSILDHVVHSVKPGALLVYITCSLYQSENEQQVKNIQEKHQFSLVKQLYLSGLEQKADTLFAAVLSRNR